MGWQAGALVPCVNRRGAPNSRYAKYKQNNGIQISEFICLSGVYYRGSEFVAIFRGGGPFFFYHQHFLKIIKTRTQETSHSCTRIKN